MKYEYRCLPTQKAKKLTREQRRAELEQEARHYAHKHKIYLQHARRHVAESHRLRRLAAKRAAKTRKGTKAVHHCPKGYTWTKVRVS